jgi:hypothetical protein
MGWVMEQPKIPPATHPIWAQVITGQKEIPSSQVGLNMLIANLRLSYQKNPSEDSLGCLVARMHEFFTRYGDHYQNVLEQILGSRPHA